MARFTLERISKSDGKHIAIKNERLIMDLLTSPALTPILASALYIGGGGIGLVLLVLVVVLLLRG
jgi:hypothetical protein